MAIYTDIAAEVWAGRKGTVPPGVRFETKYVADVTITRVHVTQDGLARRRGRYSTIDMPSFAYIDDRNEHYIGALAHEIKNYLPPTGDILVVGLGNDHITADALGPAVCGRILVTRHIPIERDERDILHLRGVSAFCPGIEGKTGLSAGETVKSVVSAVRPAAVLCIDSLFTSSPEHLGCTAQITDTGLCPGGEERKRIDTALLGVPTVCMGVPTVMDAGDLCHSRHRLVVTPKEIDYIISRAAGVLSLAINKALQQDLSVGELNFLTS